MDTADTLSIVRRFDEELFGQGNLDVAGEILTEDFSFFGPASGIRGPEAFKGFVQMLRGAFPDLRFDPALLVVDGAKVARVATLRGTHRGEMRGIPPSGAPTAVTRIDTFLFEGDRIKEVQAYLDHQAWFAALRAETERAATVS